MTARRRLILASSSAARRKMLSDAGLTFEAIPAQIDEETLRREMLERNGSLSHAEVARALAEAKAKDVSGRYPDALVIGSDQILSTGQGILSKPGTLDGARATLKTLRGRAHSLHSAAVLVENEETIWGAVDTARLTMHAFSDAFLERYLSDAGNDILGCVGAYQMEGAGVRLFKAVEGDHFAILGMPLLSLLNELRHLEEIDA
jgi:septum formation protein